MDFMNLHKKIDGTIFSASASDLSGKFGAGLSVGYPIPSFGNNFNDAADPEYAAGIHGRYHFTSKFGVELGYLHSKFKDVDTQFDSGNFLVFIVSMVTVIYLLSPALV